MGTEPETMMRYVGLCTYPHERTRVTHPNIWWNDAFTPEEVDKVGEYCQEQETKVAETLGGQSKVRVSHIAFHKWTPENGWIFDRLIDTLNRINNRFYGFELNGFDSFQYTEYWAEESGCYDWHMDLCMGANNLPADMIEPRKLSMSLLLNEPGVDFKGGDFQFNLGQESEAKNFDLKKGRIVAFPSWMIHRVTPVTEGVRRSLVVWVTGPKFT